MKKDQLLLGGVYTTSWEGEQMRVLAYDEFELFYDTWWEHKNDWGLRCYNGKMLFFRSSTSRFAESAVLQRVDPLTNEELEKYKLNLPFRICRFKNLKWTQTSFSKLQEYLSFIKKQGVTLSNNLVIDTDKIILQPFGPTGGHKKSVVIYADNGNSFSEAEILWKAHNIQSEYKTFIDSGVGLFRSGLSKKLAIYYIGGYYDLGQTIRRE